MRSTRSFFAVIRSVTVIGVVSLIALAMTTVSIPAGQGRVRAQEPTPIGAVPENPCAASPAVKLQIGDSARVIAGNKDVPGLQMRVEPSISARVMRYLMPDTQITILNGPQCALTGEQFWLARIGVLNGWVTETVGKELLLEKIDGEAASPPAILVTEALPCIKKMAEAVVPASGDAVRRIVWADAAGAVSLSDNGGEARIIATFTPAPTALDLAPEGGAIVVTNPNGVYWLDIESGTAVLLADSDTFDLPGSARPVRAAFLPDGMRIVVELEDRGNNVYSYQVNIMPLDGSGAPFRADTGAQPVDSLRRAPNRAAAVLLSARDFTLPPASVDQDSEPLLSYVPLNDDGDARNTFMPAVTWAADGKTFYTFIPKSTFAPPDDTTGAGLFRVNTTGSAERVSQPAGLVAGDYVIPSPDGKAILAGSYAAWSLRDAAGIPLQRLPVPQYIFDWTPDGKGVIYTDGTGKAAFLGTDGGTESPYLPKTNDLYGIEWLSDGSILFITRDAQGITTLNGQTSGGDGQVLGVVAGAEAYSGFTYTGTPTARALPVSCR